MEDGGPIHQEEKITHTTTMEAEETTHHLSLSPAGGQGEYVTDVCMFLNKAWI